MRFSRICIKALVATSPVIILGCGSDGMPRQSSGLAAGTPTSVAAPITTNGSAPVIAPATTTATTPAMATLQDSQDLAQRLTTLCSIMNLGAALSANALEDMFISDPNYGTSNGLTRTQDIASIVAIFGPNGTNGNGRLKSLDNLQIVSDLTANYPNRGVSKAYLLNYDFVFENGTVVHGSNATFGKELSSGQWKFIGGPTGSDIGNNYGVIFTSASDPVSPPIIDVPVSPPVPFAGT